MEYSAGSERSMREGCVGEGADRHGRSSVGEAMVAQDVVGVVEKHTGSRLR
jgi:hypothetical protein